MPVLRAALHVAGLTTQALLRQPALRPPIITLIIGLPAGTIRIRLATEIKCNKTKSGATDA